jgi:hypothetical protein
MQLIYAAELLAKKGWNVEKALTGIKIRQVDSDTTIPFFKGRINSYGVIPVIFELDKIQVNMTDIKPRDIVIPYFLDLLAVSDHWSEEWETLSDIYGTIDVSDGMFWNELIGQEIYSDDVADYSCQRSFCLGGTKDPRHANGRISLIDSEMTTSLKELRYTRDYYLANVANFPLPDHIQPFALAFLSYLSFLHPEDPVFNHGKSVSPTLVEDYLDLARLQGTYFDISNDISLLIADRNKEFRRFIYSDLQFGTPINEFYIREDFVTPVLRGGDVYVFDNGTVVEDYSNEKKTFTLRRGEENPFQLSYEDFFDYIERVEGVHPYTLRSIPRQYVAIIDGQISYHNSETGELYPLPAEKVLVRNIGNAIELIYNAQILLSLGLSLLYESQYEDTSVSEKFSEYMKKLRLEQYSSL